MTDDETSVEKKKREPCADGRVRGKPKREGTKCLTPTCTELFPTPRKEGEKTGVGARGLCRECYKKANNLVNRKFTSWEEMEEFGLAEPKYGSIVERAIKLARLSKIKVVKLDDQFDLVWYGLLHQGKVAEGNYDTVHAQWVADGKPTDIVDYLFRKAQQS